MSEESIKTMLNRNTKDIESIGKRVSDLERDQWNLSKDSQRIEEILTDLRTIVGELNLAITTMQLKPAKDFDSYKAHIWRTIIGVIVAYLLGKYI